MMRINKNILGLLGLYIAQGVPFGVAMFALPGIFRSQGSSMTQIGMLALIMLPWGLKFIWASLVDNYALPGSSKKSSHYLHWVKVCQWIGTALMAGLVLLNPSDNFTWLVFILLAIALVQSTQDIAVDALAVTMSRLNKQVNANINGTQVGGFSGGILVGGSIALFVYDGFGWQVTVIYLIAALWLAYLPFYLYQTDWQQLPDTSTAKQEHKASLLNVFKRVGSWKIIAAAFLFKFCSSIGESLVTPLLVDQDVSLSWISFITGSAMVMTICTGAFIATRISRYLSLRSLACGSLVISACCWGAMGGYLLIFSEPSSTLPLAQTSPVITSTLMVLEWLTMNIACVAFFGLFMNWCRTQQAGTDFTLLQCNEAIGGAVGMALGSSLAEFIGFGNTFIASCVAGLCTGILLFWFLGDRKLGINGAKDEL